ncbi:bile acid:sodium symporter family protein [Novosphingopyxis iocasae]|uniref:bile acid:sodium symporter family protein n=1 Tax=Novosphingopyxis iocasae TaxID=2762729 RepID=UPI001FED161E|nr:bile acid:sodium symporter family protein [Novosphingopyxis iocasae]
MMLLRAFTDRFVLLLFATVLLASVLPVSGRSAEIASIVSSAAIFLLFLLHGLRLPREELGRALKNWKLQAALFVFVFAVMAGAGYGLSHLAMIWLPTDLALGLLFLGTLPSTVQSATAYSSLAGGNVAASVVAAALLNLVGVVLTPILFAALASTAGVSVTGDAVIRIMTILLLPFALGQILQKWLRPLVAERKALVTWMDRTAIAIAVYVAFSGAVVDGALGQVSASEFAVMGAAIAAFLAFGFGGAWLVGGLLRLDGPDRRTMLFSGAQKSIAIGAPLAAILFSADRAGIILLPVLIYHLSQLVLSAPLAARLGEKRG